MPTLPEDVLRVFRAYRACEFTTVTKDGTPITHPVSAYLLDDGTFRITTSIGFLHKAFRIRNNPAVSMLFSEPVGNGLADAPVVLVQGRAVAPDEIVTDLSEDEDYWLNAIMRRQPDSGILSTWPIRLLTWWYYLRIRITVTPERIRYWPAGDTSRPAVEVPMGGNP